MTRLDRLIGRLELKEFQLKALLDVTKAINTNVGRASLLALYRDIVRDELGITRLMLFEKTARWECILAYGTSGRDTDVDVEHAFGTFKEIQGIPGGAAGDLGAFDVAVPVYHEERPLAFLLIGDIDEDEQRMSPTVKHLNFIQTLTNLIVVAMENERLALEALQRERLARELELAAEVQGMLIPTKLPSDERFEAAAWYLPHRLVGGDYYDVIRRGPDEVVIVMGDVSGKGMAAALLMSNFQATLHTLLDGDELPLDRLVHLLNRKVFQRAQGDRFITFFIARCDLSTGVVRYVNAGHNPVLHWNGREIVDLHTGSIALGMMPELPFLQVGEAQVRSGDTLLCYTDGLVEQEDAYENDLGTTPLMKAVEDFSASGPQAVNTAVVGAFEAHRDGEPYLDDIALLTCRFR